jgi:hypothetical protein
MPAIQPTQPQATPPVTTATPATNQKSGDCRHPQEYLALLALVGVRLQFF